MTKDEATMWARVARRIGLWAPIWYPELDDAGKATDEYYVQHSCQRSGEPLRFDPPANPADERLLTEYCISQRKLLVKMFPPELSDGHIAQLFSDSRTCAGEGEHEHCRVTALGKAIDALPEGEG